MKQIVYLDSYFAINFVMDLASILITSLILSRKIRWYRAAAGAILGALVSVMSLLFSLSAFWSAVAGLLSLPLILLLSFGRMRGKRAVLSAVFFTVSALFLGGAADAIHYYSGSFSQERKITLAVFLIVTSLGFTAFSLWGKGMKRKLDTTVVSLSISLEGKSCEVYGLVDSGSLLTEPISGLPVILLKAESADALLDAEKLNSLKDGTDQAMRIFAIPMRTAAGQRLLFGFRPKSVCLHNRAYRKKYKETDEVIIAVDFSEGGYAGCPCLVPLSLV